MKTLILIDGHALAYREYFALERTAMSTKDKQPTWAVYGFFKAIFDLLKNKEIKPDAIAVTFDVHKKNFRMDKFEDYKANRESMPDNMRSQMGLIQEGLKAFNIPIYTKEGFEADDVIGSIAKQAMNCGCKTYILTGDRDSFQLIDREGFVKVLIPQKGELLEYNWEKVYEKMGVYPNQIIDFKALRGDTSDNIPGIKGIGDKTAQQLLEEFKTFENIYSNIDNIKSNSIKTKLSQGYDIALLSKELATIVQDLDVNFDINKACIELPDIAQVTSFLQNMQFYSFIKNINSILALFNPTCQNSNTNETMQLGLFSQTIKQELTKNKHEFSNTVISDINDLKNKLLKKERVGIYTKTLENNIISQIEFAIEENSNIETFSLYSDKNLKNNLIILKDFFENNQIKKVVHNYKTEYDIYKQYSITLNGIDFDTLLASYIKDPERVQDIKTQALEHIGYVFSEEDDLGAYSYSLMKLYGFWNKELDEKELKLVREIEIPLSKILAEMELYGVSIDVEYLKNLTDEFSKHLDILEKDIYKIAQKEININSPKQVSDVLYNTLQIPPIRRGKNKFSTSADVLEELAIDYPICEKILEYRKYAKLKSTYTEALPELISKIDGKLHTNFNQTITATGRLSSSNPNLQNIPTRDEEAGKIRKAFRPANPNSQVLLSADYSQIELRLLAHCSNDINLIQAFNSGEDIHYQTAAKVFNTVNVTKEMRRKAKAVNFGIIYGQSKYGLSKALNISAKEAEDFINKYFETYPKVKEYMQNTIDFVHQNGFVETIFGRKRYFSANITSSNHHIKEAAERAAINQPLQGSAADLIKMAMITLYRRLTEMELKSKIILQVHDELIVETNIDELDIVKKIVKESMELNQPLKVPLEIDISYGKNWVEI
jgi:DNA polymerase-1